MTPLHMDRAESERIGRAVHAQPKACWHNAVEALALLESEGAEGACYVEGWAISRFGMVVEHGWLEHAGRVLDPTPSWWAAASEARYFAGMRYTLADVAHLTERFADADACLPFVWQTGGWGGFQEASYKQALEAAQREAYGATLEEIAERLQKLEGA